MLGIIEKEFLSYGFDSLPRIISSKKLPKLLSLNESVSMSFPINSITRPSYRDEEFPFGLVLILIELPLLEFS